MNDDGTLAETLYFEPDAAKQAAQLLNRVALGRRQPKRERKQEALRLAATRGKPAHNFFEQHALVSRVLVDDDEALPGSGQDVRVVELP